MAAEEVAIKLSILLRKESVLESMLDNLAKSDAVSVVASGSALWEEVMSLVIGNWSLVIEVTAGVGVGETVAGEIIEAGVGNSMAGVAVGDGISADDGVEETGIVAGW